MTITATSCDTPMLRFSRRAMATVFEIVFPWGTSHAGRIAADAFDFIDRLEAQLTVYRDNSETSRLNRIAHQAPVPVEPKLFELLQQCVTISQQTGGAFNITSGPLIKAWGFYRRQGRVPTDAELSAAMACVGMDKIVLDHASKTVRFTMPGVEINLGSIGKGYALDRVGEWLRHQRDIHDVLLHAGTSSVLAIGDREWQVGVKHPDEATRHTTISLKNQAMATSGSSYQHFEHEGKKLGHLIDPRSGRPIVELSMATALAPTAAEADALATAFFVMGEVATRAFCEVHTRVTAIISSPLLAPRASQQ